MVLPIVDTKGVVWYNVSQLMPLYNLDWNLVKSRFTIEENCIKAEDFVYIVACARNRYDYVNPKHEDTASCGICGKILFTNITHIEYVESSARPLCVFQSHYPIGDQPNPTFFRSRRATRISTTHPTPILHRRMSPSTSVFNRYPVGHPTIFLSSC